MLPTVDKTVTIQPGTATAGTAPLKFTSGTLLTTPEAGAIEYNGGFYMTLVGNARTAIVGTDTTQTLSNKTLASPTYTGTSKTAQGGSIEIYNTADQTTNYEKLVSRYSSNIVEVGHLYGGTGTSSRTARFGVSTVADNTGLNRYIQIQQTTPFVSYLWSGTTLSGQAVNIGGGSNSFTGSSGTQIALGIDPVINQSSTASYTALLVNPTETTTGSGTKLLADFQVGGVSKVKIDNTGVITAAAGTASGSVVTVDGTQTLTNKTLTTPKIDSIKEQRS